MHTLGPKMIDRLPTESGIHFGRSGDLGDVANFESGHFGFTVKSGHFEKSRMECGHFEKVATFKMPIRFRVATRIHR